MKQWTRSDTLALAYNRCTTCGGSGLRRSRKGGVTACKCVLRNIFRICFSRFQDCAEKSIHTSTPVLERGGSRGRRYLWSRKEEEYMADFCLLSRRALTPLEYDIFRFHFLLGGDWRLCCRRLKMDRGNFYHAVYRVEQKLGYVFRSVEPYALFPLDEYFGGATRLNLDELNTVGAESAALLSRADQPLEPEDFDPDELDEDIQAVLHPRKRVVPIRAPLAPKAGTPKEEEAA
ncbi:MAG: hypothetical protein U0R19_26395 [Bryobacteraceae bacterium]